MSQTHEQGIISLFTRFDSLWGRGAEMHRTPYGFKVWTDNGPRTFTAVGPAARFFASIVGDSYCTSRG